MFAFVDPSSRMPAKSAWNPVGGWWSIGARGAGGIETCVAIVGGARARDEASPGVVEHHPRARDGPTRNIEDIRRIVRWAQDVDARVEIHRASGDRDRLIDARIELYRPTGIDIVWGQEPGCLPVLHRRTAQHLGIPCGTDGTGCTVGRTGRGRGCREVDQGVGRGRMAELEATTRTRVGLEAPGNGRAHDLIIGGLDLTVADDGGGLRRAS